MAQPNNKSGGSCCSSLNTGSDASSSTHDSASTIENLSKSKNGSSASLKGKTGKTPVKGKNVKVVGSRYLQAALKKDEKSNNSSSGKSSLNSSFGKVPTRATRISSARSISDIQMKKIRSRAPTNVKGPGAKLHSTALNATTLLSSPVKKTRNDTFSTTIVDNIKHNNTIAELLISDISAIKPEGSSGNMTVASNFEESVQNNYVAENEDFNVKLEYLQYLNSAILDVKSEAVYLKEIQQCQNQIAFLKELESKALEEVHELHTRLELAKIKDMVECSFQSQMEKLGDVVDCLPKAEKAMDALGKNLEKMQYQTRIEGFNEPEDKKKYWDEFDQSIEEINGMLGKITLCKSPMSGQLHQARDVMEEVECEVEHMNKLETQIQKAAILAIQDASFKIGTHQTGGL
ncbi:uncharacterized protein LOC143034582 isoform X2 [Oratosquilla oratoria]|uniref:uncharacterized protein LOC143034582 isoform X2 n=1 Tax=Oratosquilla oratoria TaxID=337810 RepID=UPI003F771589